MACPHFSAKEISRGKGHSTVAASAYIARATLEDERTGETHDYTRHRSKCIFEGIYAPKDAPEWARDRAQLWNHVEAFEKHRRAILAKEIDIALPHELTPEQNRWLLQEWVKENITRKKLIADVAIHEADPKGDARNIHAHVLIVTRKLDGTEFERSKERFDTYGEKDAARKAELADMRSSWERLANKALERHGHDARIDMGRKKDGGATVHMGKRATTMERRGEASELGDRNREIEAENARRQAAANENAKPAANENDPELAELAARQRANMRQQAEDRANAMWDAADGSTLANMRGREREAGQSRSTENEARRAMDDLARTDPHGTARHFGHHAGDRLKSPEDMRRENAERLRSFAAEPTPEPPKMDRPAADPSPEPAQDSASPDPGRERGRQRPTWTAQTEGWDGLSGEQQRSARQSWEAWRDKRNPADTRPAFTLPEYVEYVQQREAKKRAAPELTRPTPAPTPAPTPERQQHDQVDARRAPLDARAEWAATLRGFAAQAPQEAARGPEPVRGPTAAAGRPRTATAPQERPGASYLRAALSSARARLQTLGARLDTVRAAILTRGSSRAADSFAGGGMAREDTSSRKVNAEAAADQRDDNRKAKAREAAVSREIAREHDEHERERERGKEKQVRQSIWETDMRRAELEAAAEQLRRALERPGEHDHSRERRP